MHDTAESQMFQAQKKEAKTKKSYGWDVYNQDSQYNAYDKRLESLRETPDDELRDANSLASFGMNAHEPSSAAIDNMVGELDQLKERRKKFSRRRQHFEDADVTSINERNAKFNKKLKRAYDK